jgi:hypothetical protein
MSITRLLKQTVTIENPNGTVSKRGEPSFSAPATYYARFQPSTKTIMNAKGEREPLDGLVFVAPDATVSIGAKLTYAGAAYRVVRRDVIPGRKGNTHHFELGVQSWSFGA